MHSTNSNNVCFLPESQALLEKCIRGLPSDGGMSEGDLTGLWGAVLKDEPESSITVDSSVERTRGSIAEIQALKSLSKSLLGLKSSLDTFIKSRTEEILPATRQHGLAILPDDILILIFGRFVHLHDTPFTGSRIAIRDLSPVCRRFRECILASTEVWTYLDLTPRGPESFDLFLDRSKNRFLNILFDTQNKTDRVVSTSKHRLRSIRVDLRDTTPYLFPLLNLPPVEELIVRGPWRSFSWTSASWPFPNAERVDIGDNLPEPASFSYEPLKTLIYRTDTSHAGKGAPTFTGTFLTRLVNFLRPAISLRTLHLRLIFRGEEYYGAKLTVELPNVKEFSISNEASLVIPNYSSGYGLEGDLHWDESRDRSDSFIAISRIFKLPNVRDVFVSLKFRGNDFDLGIWLKLAFPHLRGSPSVASLFFRFSQSGFLKSTVEFSEFFSFFPSLRSLAIDALADSSSLRFCVPFGEEGESGQDLEYLRLDFQNGEDMEDMYRMFRAMVEAGAPLRKIVIRSPYMFDIATLEKILPKADICVNTRVIPDDAVL